MRNNQTKDVEHWVIVFNWLTLGGAERQGMYLAENLVKKGHKVTVIGFSMPGVVQDMCAKLGIPCYHWPISFGIGRLSKILMFIRIALKLRGLKPDFIAPYDTVPDLICGLIWKFTGAKSLVWQQRDAGIFQRKGFLEKLVVKRVPAFISNSDHAATWLNSTYGIDIRRIFVIRNGIKLPEMGSDAGEKWKVRHGLTHKHRIVSMVANIHSFKDHITLVKAWNMVLEKQKNREDLCLVLAGNKQDTWPEVDRLITELGIEKYVLAPGVVTDVHGLYAASEMVVLSSLMEGVPNCVLEGMAHAKPIVASNIPGNIETGIDHNLNQLFESKNIGELAERIQFFLNNKSLAMEIGHLNRAVIENNFGMDRMVSETSGVFYNSVIRTYDV
jgi:glycosyltransferase involved in cell wall biosynthesis